MGKKNIETSKANQKDVAMNLYLTGRMTQRAIADLVGCNENTMKKWITDGKWDVTRGAMESSRGTILANLLTRMNNLTLELNFSADEALKLTKTIEAFSPSKLSISGQIEVINLFATYVYERDHLLAKQITPLAKEFIQNRVKNALSAK